MSLTPEDVHYKKFQPTKFREGYDQEEVDAFLDEIIVELRRLNQENEDLRQRLLASDGRIAELQRSPGGMAVSLTNSTSEIATSITNPGAAFPEAMTEAQVNEPNNTNNLLQLARKLHDEHVREGIAKRDALIAEGQATAARLLRETEAQQRSDLSRLEQEKALIEHTIQELRQYERDYRASIKSFIEAQLRDLETPTAPVAPTQGILGN
jgi:DivIVA domain-containing protein